jgi:mannosyl-3-phosphoglycerate phosphatase
VAGGTRGCPARRWRLEDTHESQPRSEAQGIRFVSASLRVTLIAALLAPRHLIFTALEGALVDSHTGSFSEAEEALSELDRRKIAVILLTSRTRAEIEPLRRKLGHNHPFITEAGGGIFFPDGYLNIRIPGAARTGRYLGIAQGRPYEEVCAALDDIALECGVGVAGFHHMSLREIADNTGLRPRDAELARSREYDEPFFFTSADEKAIARFVSTASEHGYQAQPRGMFWHLSAGCDPARAVQTVTKLFREETHSKLSAVGIGAAAEDLPWLRVVDHAFMLPSSHANADASETDQAPARPGRNIAAGDAPGPAGWNSVILNIISQFKYS